LEGTEQGIVDTHHRASVVKLPSVVMFNTHIRNPTHLSTVIWRREQRHQLSLGEELVTILHDLVSAFFRPTPITLRTHLMRSADQVHVMFLQESGDDIRAKRE
jgi:hypothetical protein